MASGRTRGAITAAALLLPLAASTGEPGAGAQALQLAPASSGGRVAAGPLLLEFSIGQPLAGRARGAAAQAAATGFWTTATLPDDGLFADGFEETSP